MDIRAEILEQIENNRQKQDDLKKQEIELCKKYIQCSDEQQWFKEEERTVGRGKKKRTYLEGRLYWIQHFVDGDTGGVIQIERSRAVSENGAFDIQELLQLI